MDSNMLRSNLPTHLTLFYSIRTGEIKKYTTGITDLYKAFGQNEGEELSLIYDTIVIDYDEDNKEVILEQRNYEDIIKNYKDYKIENSQVVCLKTTIEDLEQENADLVFALMEAGVL